MSKQSTIEGVYDGLLESVRRVDSFPKTNIFDSNLSVEDVINMIDKKLIEYNTAYNLLTLDSDDLEVGTIGGYIEALEILKKSILNNGE